jgi:hypothetical protein
LEPEEEASLMHAYPSPWLRLRVLRYPGAAEGLPAEAAERLRRLVVAARVAGPPRANTILPVPADELNGQHGTLLPCLVVVVSFLLLTALAVIGALRVWHWWLDF